MALCVGQATAKDRLIPKDQEAENRAEALDDLRFAKLGEQWPEHVRLQRIKDGRPCWSQGMTGLQSLWITVTPSFIILGLSR